MRGNSPNTSPEKYLIDYTSEFRHVTAPYFVNLSAISLPHKLQWPEKRCMVSKTTKHGIIDQKMLEWL